MLRHRAIRLSCLILLGSFLLSVASFAQDKATIVGTITDPTGAVVPGVKVTVTNTGTMVSRVVETNSAGNYIAPELPIGKSSVRAEFKGFKAYERTGIVLNVNDNLRVDIQMEVGEVTQSVTVSEVAVVVQTESGEVSDVISGQQVTQLAINGRNFFQLATLIPGASSLMPDFNLPIPVGSSGAISFNGMRPDHNMWMIDGGENYDRGCGGCVTVMPSMDAIAEFRVQTSNYGPDFGLGSSATVNMALKSGARDFHGGAYEFVRNDRLDAFNFFANKSNALKKPPLKYNNFGWNLGGPLYVPGKYNTDKRKTFFFFNEEWRRLRQGTQFFAPAIPAAERTGNFSGELTGQTDANGNDKGAIFVPQPRPGQTLPPGLVAGQPFPGNIIPSPMQDNNAVALGAPNFIFPLPTTAGGKFAAAPSVPINVREEIVRVDQTLTDKIQLMGHFINDAVVQQTPNTLWWGPTYPTVGTLFGNPAKHAVLKMTWTINPTFLNELSADYDGNRIHLVPTGNFALPSGVSNLGNIFPGNNLNRIPDINLSGQRFGVNYAVGPFPWDNSNDNMTYRDDLTKMTGKHALKFGGFLMRSRKKQDLFGETQGAFTFNGGFTAAPYAGGSSGNEFADFLLGRAFQYNELALQDRGHWRFWSYGLYLADSWRVIPRLTLQLGLRWEALPHTYERYDRQSNFFPSLFDPANSQSPDPATGNMDPNGPGFQTVSGVPLDSVIPGIRFYMNGIGIAGKNGIARGLVDNHYDTIGPRLGFAYDLFGNGKTILRGGYGEFFERIQGNDVYNMAPNPPFSYSPTIFDTTLTNTGGSQPIPPAGLTALDKRYLAPTTHQWSFGVQRELLPQAVLSVEYVGSGGTHQRIQRDLNQPFMNNPLRGTTSPSNIRPYPGFASITYGEDSTSSNYNSLQVNLRINNYHGLAFQTAYTWSHSIDLGGTGDFASVMNAYDLRADRGNSDFDRRHMLIFNYVYDLPFFKGSSGMLKHGLAGWQISGISTFQTGTPFSVGFPGDPSGTGNGVRANLIGNPNNGEKSADAYFNTSAFAGVDKVGVNGSTGFGDSGRNVVWGAGRNQWDFSLFKNFTGIPLHGTEGGTVQFRAEFFNSFNHTQFSSYFTSFGAPSTGFGGANGAHDARVIELGLKLMF
ncbi:MAG: hypothetical protein DMG23_03965 [Acidobacteria bacterium]|nr:MAG: hypothetical protein DMG23_03965 [Acidobacteriota bacterium]